MANTTIPSELIQASVALGGSPTTTTQSASDNTTKIATTAYVTSAVNALIDSAPGTMNTLNEIAAALNDDAAFNTTVTNAIATKLPLGGGTMTGNIALGDNNKAIFGANDDLQIYSDGTHSRIYESGSGLLVIRASNFNVNNADGSDSYIAMSDGGAVTAFYDGSAKLATTATGIDVTGNVFAAGGSFYVGANGVVASDSTTRDLNFAIGNNTPKMTLDTSGNLLVGNTDTTPYDRTSGNAIALGDGLISSAQSGGNAAIFNRMTSDGSIVGFRKDGSEVGSIGNISSRMYIGSGDTGIFFDSIRNQIQPCNTLTGSNIDATIDLGRDVFRFKDLYLSGNAYVGNAVTSSTNGSSDLKLEGNQHIFRKGVAGGYAERMRIDSSGNLLVGGTSTPYYNGGIRVHSASSVGNIQISAGDKTGFSLMQDSGGTAYLANRDNAGMNFYTNNTQRMTIDSSGNVGIGQTPGTPRLNVTAAGTAYAAYLTFQTSGTGMGMNVTAGGSQTFHFYFSNGTYVGQVYTTGSTTVWASASDYRLKENVVTDWDATTRLKQLKPSRFNFIKDADTTMDGFLAHEVQDIVPEAVIGEKDGLKADGTPKYQGIDPSKLVPLLTKAIQEQQTLIESLTARIETLEG